MDMDIDGYGETKKTSFGGILDFTLLANPLGPSRKAKHAMRKALKAVHLFPDRETPHLRRAVAKRAHVLPGNILFGHGSIQILGLLLSRLRPRKVLVPTPLPAYLSGLLRRHGADLVPFPLCGDERFTLPMARLLPHLDGVDMLLVPNPHPLTGTVIAPDPLYEIMDRLEGGRTMLVLDEGLIEYAGAASPVERAVASGNALILRSFSLFHALAGLRLGYALGGQAMVDLISSVIDPGPVGTVAAAGALASLRDRGFQRRTAEFLKAEKAYLTGKLSRVETISVIDTACNFLLAKMEGSAAELQERLLQWHILVEGFEDVKGATYLRLPLRTHQENARLAKALGRIAAEERTVPDRAPTR
jgi:threonine-phosphate decarboxylase